MAARKGNIKAHKRKMILLYVGAILIAGAFTLMPGRYLHHVFFG
ncbi:MAG: putative membrane protein [Flavobacteriales bacterium]